MDVFAAFARGQWEPGQGLPTDNIEEPQVTQETQPMVETPTTSDDFFVQFARGERQIEPQVSQEPVVSSQEVPVTQGEIAGDFYGMPEVIPSIAGRQTEAVAKVTGLPKAVATYQRGIAGLQRGVSNLLGFEEAEKISKESEDYWKQKVKDFSIAGFDTNVFDNPSNLLNPLFWTYQAGQMAPALAGGVAGGVQGALIGGGLLSMPQAVDVYESVLKDTNGDKFAAAGAAATSFTLNTALEALGLDRILKPVGTIGTRMFKGFITEGGTEFSQTLLDNIQQAVWEKSSEGMTMPEIVDYIRPQMGSWLKDALSAGLVGGVLGGGISGVSGTNEIINPQSNTEAEQILAKYIPDTVDPRTAGMDPSIKAKIEEFDRLREVTPEESVDVRQIVEPIRSPLQEINYEATPTQTQEAVATPEPSPEQGVLQPTEAGQTQAQEVQAELPSVPVFGEMQLQGEQQVTPQPEQATPQISTEFQGAPLEVVRQAEPQLTPEEQVSQAQERMYGRVPEAPVTLERELTPQEIESLKGVEPSGYSQIDTYFGKDINKPLSGFVRLVRESGLEGKVLDQIEKITGQREKSLVTGATKVGHTTFKNLVYQTVKQERILLLEEEGGFVPQNTTEATTDISPGTTGTQDTTDSTGTTDTYTTPLGGPTVYISDEIQSTLGNSPELLQEFQNDAAASRVSDQEIAQVVAEEDTNSKRLLSKIDKIKPMSVVRIVKKLGITSEVIEELNKVMDRAYSGNLSSYFVRAGNKLPDAVRRAVNRKRIERAIQKRYDAASIQPSTAVSSLENTLGRDEVKSVTKALKGNPITPDQIEDKAQASLEKTREFVKNQREKTAKEAIQEGYAEREKGLAEWAKRYLGSADIILDEISTKLGGIMKRFESSVMTKVKERQDSVQSFRDWYRKANATDKQQVRKALLNRNHPEERTILERMMNKDPELLEAMKSVDKVLNEIQNEYVVAGLLSKISPHYFPNVVDNFEGLMEYMTESKGSPEVLKSLRELTGNKRLTEKQAQEIMRNVLERGSIPALILNPSNSKARAIFNVTEQMQKFYLDPVEALDSHIKNSTEAIEQRKVIGSSKIVKMQKRMEQLSKKLSKTTGELMELEALTAGLATTELSSVGELTEYMTEAVQKGWLSVRDQKLAMEIFHARFNQRHMGKLLGSLKDLSLVSALGQFGSTITQLSDVVPLILSEGPMAAINAMAAAPVYTKDDVDVNSALKDWTNDRRVSKLLDTILRLTQFERVDGFFSSAKMTAALRRAKGMTEGDFNSKYEHIFGEDTKTLWSDIQNDNYDSHLAKEYAVIELANVRPLFPTNMPVGYMRGGNMRILYALKSWTLKTLNNLRRDILRVKSEKGVAAATLTAVAYTTLLALGGAGADTVKDLLLGRSVDPSEKLIDNILKLFTLSRFDTGKLIKGDISSVLMDHFAPPLGFLEKPIADLYAAWNPDKAVEWKSLKEIPLFGTLLWWRGTTAGAKKRMTEDRQRIFGLLSDAIKEKDPELMDQFRMKRREFNDKVREFNTENKLEKDDKVKPITFESVERTRSKIKKKIREDQKR